MVLSSVPPGSDPIDVQQQQDIVHQLAQYQSNPLIILGSIDYVSKYQGYFLNRNMTDLK